MYKPLNIGLHCVQNMGATVAMAKLDTNVSCIINRVGQNHIHTVYIRYFWQGNHQIYGVYIRFWPTLLICDPTPYTYTVLRLQLIYDAVHSKVLGDDVSGSKGSKGGSCVAGFEVRED